MADSKELDVVTVGRSSVDLYGEQVGGRLEDMASFAKYVGGCPTNIAVGTARLGLRSALITRVGDEHMGRFIKEQCAREGVDVRGVVTDPQRLTALVILGIRDKDTFPLIFYRENCADAALTEADIDEDLIAAAKAVVVTGTHFSTRHPRRRLAQGDAARQGRMAAGSCSTSTTARSSGASPATAWARSASSPATRSRRTCRPSCPSAISSSAPRRRSTSPAAAPTPWRRSARSGRRHPGP